jgi:steroid delta-isomerase-like uncharacterized protein
MSTEQNKAIVRRWVAGGWNTGDLSMVDEFYAADYTLHSPGAPDLHGQDAFKAYVTMFRTAFPDIHFTIEDMVAEDDKVAWRATTRGTHGGELMGIPPTGKSVVVSSSIVSRFDAGKWAEDWVLIDTIGMLQQLGVIPMPSQPA